jgi:hypothetical protein
MVHYTAPLNIVPNTEDYRTVLALHNYPLKFIVTTPTSTIPSYSVASNSYIGQLRKLSINPLAKTQQFNRLLNWFGRSREERAGRSKKNEQIVGVARLDKSKCFNAV